MARNLKLFVHGSAVEVCFRTEEGLPLIASPYIRVILSGILARAQTLYPVTICHYIVMANHFHMILVVDNPEDIKDFVAYIKRESAHAINRLLGRRQRTIWGPGYDSPTLLDTENVIKRIVHLYTNPQNANLVKKIEHYPNLSTWEHFINGGGEEKHKRIHRDGILPIPKRDLSFNEQYELTLRIQEEAREENVMYIEPDAWMQCFEEYQDCKPELINNIIIQQIRDTEQFLDKKRKGKSLLGAHALRLANMRKTHTPKKHGRRMLCLSSVKNLVKIYVEYHRAKSKEAREVFHKQRVGNYHAKRPPGFFEPGGLLNANILPSAIPWRA